LSSNVPKHPLCEVFGHTYNDMSKEAKRHRKNRLCPFNNKVPSCTKDKANDPLGVCSIYDSNNNSIAITCPIRFRQNWIIVEDAANFFFPKNTNWTSLAEIRLNDKYGKSAGNIDIVLVSYDANGIITDFGALEVQAVYISGNIRRPFQEYLKNPNKWKDMDWQGEMHYPRPDYLSSSRKRLLPQLLYKGQILQTWKKKIAVTVHTGFYNTLPKLPEVPSEDADIAWPIYDLELNNKSKSYQLKEYKKVYTKFHPALNTITKSSAGSEKEFLEMLQKKLDEQLEINPPNAPTILQNGEE